RLQSELRPVRLFFVMGADSFRDVTSWHEYEGILSEYDVVVAMRPNYYEHTGHHHDPGPENGVKIAGRLAPHLETRIVDLRGGQDPSNEALKSPRIYLTDYVTVDVSATGIREAIEQGRPIDDMVPPSVAAYIEKYRLYRKS